MFLQVVYSKQISKMVVSTWFERLYRVIKYAGSKYDIVNNMICTMEPANNGHPRTGPKWPLCKGDRYRQVGYNMGSP